MAAAQRGHTILPLLLLLTAPLFLSAYAQYTYEDEDASTTPSVSYISASPFAAPGPEASYEDTAEPLSELSDADDSSTQGFSVQGGAGDDATSGATFGTMLATVDTKPVAANFQIPAVGRVGVNKFVHSVLVASVSKTDKFIQNVIQKRLADPNADSYTKECLQTCKEVYEDSVGAMKKTLEDIQEGNYFKANVDVSAMSNDADTCKECVKQVIGEDPDFDKFSKWIDGVTDQCLDKITGVSS